MSTGVQGSSADLAYAHLYGMSSLTCTYAHTFMRLLTCLLHSIKSLQVKELMQAQH